VHMHGTSSVGGNAELVTQQQHCFWDLQHVFGETRPQATQRQWHTPHSRPEVPQPSPYDGAPNLRQAFVVQQSNSPSPENPMHSGKAVYSPVLEQQHAPTRISPSSSILSTSVLVRDFVCVRTGGAGDGEASGRRGFLAESGGAGDLDEAFERELRALTVGAIAPRIQASRRLRLGGTASTPACVCRTHQTAYGSTVHASTASPAVQSRLGGTGVGTPPTGHRTGVSEILKCFGWRSGT
jgi:hypothetical protein